MFRSWDNRSLVMFDLDGTLAENKRPVRHGILKQIIKLSNFYNIGIISGCSSEQFRWQFIDPWNELPKRVNNFNMFLLPTCGAEMRSHGGWGNPWQKRIYNNDLTFVEKVRIVSAFDFANQEMNYPVSHDINLRHLKYGEIVNDRQGQVTFSMLGKDAPVELRSRFDQDYLLRKEFAFIMQEDLGMDFSVRFGGTTSIDVSKRGIDKRYGVNKLLEHLSTDLKDMIYFGDKFGSGGNDEPVKQMGARCIEVKSSYDTFVGIEELIDTKGELCDL